MSAPDKIAAQAHAASATNPMRGIMLKVVSVFFFVGMATMLKATQTVPSGQMVFFRSFFALLPVLAYLGWKGRLGNAFATKRPVGHILRGLVGVVIILWPRLTVFSGGAALGDAEAVGALAAFLAAVLSAFAMMAVRNLVHTERTEAIVTYFFVSASVLSLLTLPFGWIWPTPQQAALLIGAGFFGGIGQLLMTSSYRHADMSVIAPFEYVSLILTIVLGYFIFADVPTLTMILGALIIIGSGIAVILREHRLGLDRVKSKEANTP